MNMSFAERIYSLEKPNKLPSSSLAEHFESQKLTFFKQQQQQQNKMLLYPFAMKTTEV